MRAEYSAISCAFAMTFGMAFSWNHGVSKNRSMAGAYVARKTAWISSSRPGGRAVTGWGGGGGTPLRESRSLI